MTVVYAAHARVRCKSAETILQRVVHVVFEWPVDYKADPTSRNIYIHTLVYRQTVIIIGEKTLVRFRENYTRARRRRFFSIRSLSFFFLNLLPFETSRRRNSTCDPHIGYEIYIYNVYMAR